jgi:hypothetical protein
LKEEETEEQLFLEHMQVEEVSDGESEPSDAASEADQEPAQKSRGEGRLALEALKRKYHNIAKVGDNGV